MDNAAPETTKSPRPYLRAELTLGFLLVLSAILCGWMFFQCLPYFEADEDPQSILQHQHQQDTPIVLPTRPAVQEETDSTGPTVQATIPPESNPYDKYDFQYNNRNYLLCTRQQSYSGIDVSAYQGEINWEKVAASGIQYAIIRLGFRGYGSGKLVEDDYARENLEGAREAGLKVGAYFFSQALNIQEVDEEIEFMLEILGDFQLDMPLILDWEYISNEARTADMDARTLTDCQIHFCKTVSKMGYQPMLYFNWHQARSLLYLNELEEWPFWLALYQDRMTFPYHVEMWQYTCTGRVPGIKGDVDINVYMPKME